jgi:CheY-like chemotaxis protein
MAQSKILIADDNLTNVELLEAYLDGLDCEIAVATDGRDTLDKVAVFQPDLILLDIMMPKLSGFEVCKILKRDPITRRIMILMVTALNESGDIERAVAAGCDDFLSKPVNKLELVKRVEIMLRLRHVTDERDRLRRYIESMEEQARPGRQRESLRQDGLGITVADLSEAGARKFGGPVCTGVEITRVEPGSPADAARLNAGALIVEVNREVIRSIVDFRAAMAKRSPAEPISLVIRKDRDHLHSIEIGMR